MSKNSRRKYNKPSMQTLRSPLAQLLTAKTMRIFGERRDDQEMLAAAADFEKNARERLDSEAADKGSNPL
jgi:hypothetical protein